MARACAFATVALLLANLAACGPAGDREKRAQAVPVTVVAATVSSRPQRIEATGTVEPSDSVAVKSRVDATIKTVLFKEGDLVKEGQPLYQLDDAMVRSQVAAAVAQRERDAATARQTAAEYARAQKLASTGFVSRSALDQARANAEAAAAATKADAAQIDVLRTQLAYYSITAPVGGRTGESASKPGAAIKANDTSALVTINRVSPVRVRFAIPPSAIAAAHQHFVAGTAVVTAQVHGDNRPAVSGKLVFLDNAIDPANGQLLAKGEFANEDERLWPGSLVDTVLELGATKVIALPESSVQLGEDGAAVFVAKNDNTAERRRVVIAGRGQGVEYVAKGLAPGEHVVVEGAARLQSGAKITVRQALASEGGARRTP
jgi:multidrug efflux system membrane fusion protein